jgi:hypothetical protein
LERFNVSSTKPTGLLVAKGAFLHPENYDFQETFLSNTKSVLTKNHVLDAATCTVVDFPIRVT